MQHGLINVTPVHYKCENNLLVVRFFQRSPCPLSLPARRKHQTVCWLASSYLSDVCHHPALLLTQDSQDITSVKKNTHTDCMRL